MIREFTILVVASLATLAGCAGGHTIYARPGIVCDKAIEAGQIWEAATGEPISVQCVSPENPKPADGDWIEAVAPGTLGSVGIVNTCGKTSHKSGAPYVIQIDLMSVSRNGFSIRDILLHEMGHWLGAHHLAVGQEGIMSAVHEPNGATERASVSCADVADVCAELGFCPAPSCEQ